MKTNDRKIIGSLTAKGGFKNERDIVDKRYVSSYQKMWHFDNDIATYLKLFTGEIKAKNYPEIVNFNTCKTPEKRIYLNELVPKAQSILISFFQQNKLLIVSDILHGRGALAADWMLVTKVQNEKVEWVLVDINFAMNHFGSGDIIISKRGSLHIGGITLQRKGGSPDSTKLQFKIHPCSLFI